MRQSAAIAVCAIYIALAPLCLVDMHHGSHAHADMHMASDTVPVSLSYHTSMYRSFTTTLLSTFTLIVTLLMIAFGRLVVRQILPTKSTWSRPLRRYAPSPPDPIRMRLALFVHAPPALA